MNIKKGIYSLSIVAILANAVLAFSGNIAAHPWISFAIFATAIFAMYRLVTAEHEIAGMLSPLVIIIVGIVLRLCFLGYPLSDDVNRYAWEGLVMNKGINPYVTAPAQIADQYKDDIIFQGINHQDVPTAYPPVALLSFRAISKISYSLFTYKIFFIIIDCLVLVLLSCLLAILRKPQFYLIIYAWNPLILLNGAGEGHFDVLHILFITAAFIMFALSDRSLNSQSDSTKKSGCDEKNDFGINKAKRESYKFASFTVLAFFFLGTAVMTKFLSLIFLPFLITRKNIKFIPIFLLPFLAYIPFIKPGMFQGLMTFSGRMAYNDVIPKILRLFLSGTPYMIAILAVFVLGLGFIWLFCQSIEAEEKLPFRAMFYAYFWCLLCLPCVHIWYLMPLVLLLVFYPARSGFLLCATIALGFQVMSYQFYHGEWIELSWVWILTWLPPMALLLRDWRRGDSVQQEDFSVPDSVDIIIPVHNEEENITTHLSSLQSAITAAEKTDIIFRVIVVDSNSTDKTLESAGQFKNKLNLEIIRSAKKGRGNQIAAGFACGQGDIAVTLHADSIVHDDALTSLICQLRRNPATAWGILGHNYDKSSLRMDKVRFMNRLRFLILGIAFGDQGIFARRAVIESRGGIPAFPLMEDVEISLRLSGLKRLNLGENLTVSTRRWEKHALMTYSLQVIIFISIFLVSRRLGLDMEKVTGKLYHHYYGDHFRSLFSKDQNMK